VRKRYPKKDLLIIREELGKVIGFKVYQASPFDFSLKKYELGYKVTIEKWVAVRIIYL
jgi:hypothetical protein